MTGFSESTVRNFRRQKSEIKASLDVAKKLFSGNANAFKRVLTNYSAYNRLVTMMEFYLEKWIERKFKDGRNINGLQTRNQALVLYNTLIKKNKIKIRHPLLLLLDGLINLRKGLA